MPIAPIGWQEMGVGRDTEASGMDKEDVKKCHYDASAKVASAKNATGNLIDLHDAGQMQATKMIESLAFLAIHGVQGMDLVPALMTTPAYDPAQARRKEAEEAILFDVPPTPSPYRVPDTDTAAIPGILTTLSERTRASRSTYDGPSSATSYSSSSPTAFMTPAPASSSNTPHSNSAWAGLTWYGTRLLHRQSTLDRARAAGSVLAQVLIQRHLGVRPITLVGFSLGARVIFLALIELAKHKAYGGRAGCVSGVLGATLSVSTPPPPPSAPSNDDNSDNGRDCNFYRHDYAGESKVPIHAGFDFAAIKDMLGRAELNPVHSRPPHIPPPTHRSVSAPLSLFKPKPPSPPRVRRHSYPHPPSPNVAASFSRSLSVNDAPAKADDSGSGDTEPSPPPGKVPYASDYPSPSTASFSNAWSPAEDKQADSAGVA
ncbi:hypothetical protein MKEN_00390200 [Mycena kentingensis (nom. inval.)]|nr:hypothetical protein MKEN_00390200 [Mycena kentingensis (nom. inval.)]